MSEKDGGAAFPQPIVNAGTGSGIVTADECDAGGMSLRAYIATAALQGILSAGTGALHEVAEAAGEQPERMAALAAVECADALIAELSK